MRRAIRGVFLPLRFPSLTLKKPWDDPRVILTEVMGCAIKGRKRSLCRGKRDDDGVAPPGGAFLCVLSMRSFRLPQGGMRWG